MSSKKLTHILSALVFAAICAYVLSLAHADYAYGLATETWSSTPAIYRDTVERMAYDDEGSHKTYFQVYKYHVDGKALEAEFRGNEGVPVEETIFYDPNEPFRYSFTSGVRWPSVGFWLFVSSIPALLCVAFLGFILFPGLERFLPFRLGY